MISFLFMAMFLYACIVGKYLPNLGFYELLNWNEDLWIYLTHKKKSIILWKHLIVWIKLNIGGKEREMRSLGEDWSYISNFGLKFSSYEKTIIKIQHEWYLTLSLLSKIIPRVQDICWHSGHIGTTFCHIGWNHPVWAYFTQRNAKDIGI